MIDPSREGHVIEKRPREQLELLRRLSGGVEARRLGEEGLELDGTQAAQRVGSLLAIRGDRLERMLKRQLSAADLIGVPAGHLGSVDLAQRGADLEEITREAHDACGCCACRIVGPHGLERFRVDLGERDVVRRGRPRHDQHHREGGGSQRNDGQPSRAPRVRLRNTTFSSPRGRCAGVGKSADDALGKGFAFGAGLLRLVVGLVGFHGL